MLYSDYIKDVIFDKYIIGVFLKNMTYFYRSHSKT